MSTNVFVAHDPHSPPPHPGTSHTRFVCISDTHSRLFPVPPGDVLLHAGDLCSYGRISDLRKTVDWLKSLPHPVKIIIAGNHDLCLDQDWGHIFDTAEAQNLVRGKAARRAGVFYLQHEAMQFTTVRGCTWKVYGSPAAPLHVEGSFQYTNQKEARGGRLVSSMLLPAHPVECEDIYSRIPLDTDILLTHTPPYKAHDRTGGGKHAGCEALATRVQGWAAAPKASRPKKDSSEATEEEGHPGRKCKLHVWGHIHEAYGATVMRGQDIEIVQVNAALAKHGTPIIVDLPNYFRTVITTR